MEKLYWVQNSDLSNGCFYIPAGVTSIGVGAFADCSGLTQVTIPAGVTSIGDGAFYDCTGITQMTIPGSVMSIGLEAFSNCSQLSYYIVPMMHKQIATLLPNDLRKNLYPESCRTKFYDLLGRIPRLNAVYQHQEMCGMTDELMGVVAQYVGNELLEKEYREALLEYTAMPIPLSDDKEQILRLLMSIWQILIKTSLNPSFLENVCKS